MIDKLKAIATKRTKTDWPKDFGRTDFIEDGAMAIGPTVLCDMKAQNDQNFILMASNCFDEMLAVVEAVEALHNDPDNEPKAVLKRLSVIGEKYRALHTKIKTELGE